MRTFPSVSLLLVLVALPALAETQKPHHARATGPQAIGTFEDWTAATDKEGGQTICYAFTRARSSAPAQTGRGDVVLTVTERPGGRDAVAISAGYAFPANATVKFTVERDSFDFYTAQRSAFARDGHAVVRRMERAGQAVSRGPGPKGADVTDTFSLRGFHQAYAAIVKRCPAGKGGG